MGCVFSSLKKRLADIIGRTHSMFGVKLKFSVLKEAKYLGFLMSNIMPINDAREDSGLKIPVSPAAGGCRSPWCSGRHGAAPPPLAARPPRRQHDQRGGPPPVQGAHPQLPHHRRLPRPGGRHHPPVLSCSPLEQLVTNVQRVIYCCMPLACWDHHGE